MPRKNAHPSSLTFQELSRREALLKVKRYFKRAHRSPNAEKLIGLFNLQAEELLEAGLPYETVKSLERRCLF